MIGGQTRKVLVVDDDDVIRELATVALEVVGGWAVLTAGNGHQAQELAEREHPDVVLLDVMMPGRDGPETVAALSEDPRTHSIPVVFLTAKHGDVDDGLAKAPNLAGVIAKPFDPMTLAEQIRTLLGWQP